MTHTQFNQLTERLYDVLSPHTIHSLEWFRSATRFELREIGITVDVTRRWWLYRSEADEYGEDSFAGFDSAFSSAEYWWSQYPDLAPDEIHCFEDGILVRRYDARTGGLL